MALKKGTEIPTIDVVLITIVTDEAVPQEYALDTANKLGVEPQIDTKEAAKLIVKGKLLAQKPAEKTLVGNVLTLSDNVFIPEVVKILQGGEVQTTTTGVEPDIVTKVTGYLPPAVGSADKGETFTLCAYSAQYNAAGQITQYEKIAYPNCTGEPVALNSEDGVFRVPEYKINSMPNTGQRPYEITYIDELPTVA